MQFKKLISVFYGFSAFVSADQGSFHQNWMSLQTLTNQKVSCEFLSSVDVKPLLVKPRVYNSFWPFSDDRLQIKGVAAVH
jgi:hypothetical protein